MEKNLKRVIVLLVILVVIAIALVIHINRTKSGKENAGNIQYGIQNSENEIEYSRLESLNNKTEASRIKTYVGQFFTALESRDYAKAYNMLFDSFKDNYFKTEALFQEYAISKYPANIVLNYINIEREGNYYIAELEVIDGINNQSKISQRIVVEEIGLNEFKVSFQV